MKIGQYHLHRYHHPLLIIQHLLVAWAILFHFDLVWLLLGFIAKELFKGVGDEIGAHRYFTHKSFQTTRFKENLLMILHFFNMQGPLLSYIGIHRMHHAFSDTDKDPHTPKKGIFKVMYWLNPIQVSPSLIRDYIRDRRFRFVADWYYELYIGFSITFIYFFGLLPYAYLFSLPVILGVYLNAIVNIYCHNGRGIQDHDTEDASRNKNSRFMEFLLKGGHLHNNHHARASSYTTAIEKDEYDFFGKIIERFFKK